MEVREANTPEKRKILEFFREVWEKKQVHRLPEFTGEYISMEWMDSALVNHRSPTKERIISLGKQLSEMNIKFGINKLIQEGSTVVVHTTVEVQYLKDLYQKDQQKMITEGTKHISTCVYFYTLHNGKIVNFSALEDRFARMKQMNIEPGKNEGIEDYILKLQKDGYLSTSQ